MGRKVDSRFNRHDVSSLGAADQCVEIAEQVPESAAGQAEVPTGVADT